MDEVPYQRAGWEHLKEAARLTEEIEKYKIMAAKLEQRLAEEKRQSAAWEETAGMFARNAKYYKEGREEARRLARHWYREAKRSKRRSDTYLKIANEYILKYYRLKNKITR